MEILNEWKSFLYLGVTMFLGWIGWSLKKRFVPREEHERLVARVDRLDNTMALLPTAKEINSLRLKLDELSTNLKVFDQRHLGTEAKLDRLTLQIDRMDAYLREKAK